MENHWLGKFNKIGRGVKSHSFYDYITSRENIFAAWREFQNGKMKKSDVLNFAKNFEENLLNLRNDIISGRYRHGGYKSFFVCDPKRRHIHKASARDRVLHHAAHRVLYPIFNKSFIFDSYSSRKDKGTHKAIERFGNFARKLSQNNTKTVWVLKCDIRKFFDSVDHRILLSIIKNKINDFKTINIIEDIIFSFKKEIGKGIPLGNLTSQLFSNVYLNELDQFIKRKLRAKYYIRYADDFVVLDRDRAYLENLLSEIDKFLAEKLDLQLHPQKIIIEKHHQGVDFLGYVIFPHHNILRTKTKNRIINKMLEKSENFEGGLISETNFSQSLQSYFGILKHCRGRGIKKKIKEIIFGKAGKI